jgi:hypothetical protein
MTILILLATSNGHSDELVELLEKPGYSRKQGFSA